MKILAAAIALLTAAVHIFVGGYDTLLPMREALVDPAVRLTLEAVWHFTSIILLVSVYAFWTGGRLGLLFAAAWAIFAMIFFVTALLLEGAVGLTLAPQWIILSIGAVAGYFAAKSKTAKSSV